jgi:hypothetical protein
MMDNYFHTTKDQHGFDGHTFPNLEDSGLFHWRLWHFVSG